MAFHPFQHLCHPISRSTQKLATKHQSSRHTIGVKPTTSSRCKFFKPFYLKRYVWKLRSNVHSPSGMIPPPCIKQEVGDINENKVRTMPAKPRKKSDKVRLVANFLGTLLFKPAESHIKGLCSPSINWPDFRPLSRRKST